MTDIGTSDIGLAQPRASAAQRLTFDYNRLVNGFFWLTIAIGGVAAIEPSPYDILILITIVLWAFRGFTVHRAIGPYVLFQTLWVIGGFIGLIPYWNEEDPVVFMFHTVFITTTGLFFALFCSQRTTERSNLLLSAYTVSCVIAATIGFLAWLGLFGDGELLIKDGRAVAPFKDPNVLGSYLVTGVLFLVQRLMLGRWRYLWLTLPSLAIIVTTLFLSFSRGSWGAAVLGTIMVAAFMFRTADSTKMRAQIVGGAVGVFVLGAVALTAALSIDSLREFFLLRASVTQDYDEGPNGRFGNQMRSLPMMLDLPNGFGPLRFRLTFGLEPHNSYVNAFASNGWLGGFSFILMVLSTCFVGFRLCLTRHPWNRQAQVLFAATFVFFVQGFQIDLDHWRMFYLSLGAIWGLEAARRRWLTQRKASL